MPIEHLNSFLDKQAELKPFIVETEGKGNKWGRLVCHWNEKATHLDHIFTPLINLQTGEIYLDCSKKKIYTKFIFHTIMRTIHIGFKTLYHLAIPISIPYIVCQTIEKGRKANLTEKEIAKNCLKNSVKSLIDIIRTPLYGIAMTIVNLAALIIGPFAPRTLYTFREITGKLIQSLYREESFVEEDIFPCFQSFDHLQKMNHYSRRDHDDTEYAPHATAYEKGLNNFARSQVKFRRDVYSPFSNLFGKLNPHVRFVSPAYGDVEKVMVLSRNQSI